MDRQEATPIERPVVFAGDIGDYIALAIVNALLSLVTLGIYRFWAKTRVRRYLWGHTSYAGSDLEYRGRGLELFLGAIIATILLIAPLVGLQLVTLGLAKDNPVLGFVGIAAFYLLLFWLIGVALYRSLRYRLAKTAWRGIRGGVIGSGVGYANLMVGMFLLQAVTLGLAAPYTTTRLWNRLWRDASFGSAPIRADAPWQPLLRRFVISLAGAFAVYGVAAATAYSFYGSRLAALAPRAPGVARPLPPDAVTMVFGVYGILLVALMAVGLIMLGYHAAMRRNLVDHTWLGPIRFRFDATARDWLFYYLGNAGLLIVTFGLAWAILPYRFWRFNIAHLSTIGDMDFDALEQTSLAAPRQGEGLADAFDLAPF